jgi:bifunctional non-homologous end joining protein LigD
MRWDEILGEETADRWNVKNLPRRLASLKEDPWAGFSSTTQRLTAAMRREVERGARA